MRDGLRVQSEFNWSDSNYLSLLGIIHEDIEALISANEYRYIFLFYFVCMHNCYLVLFQDLIFDISSVNVNFFYILSNIIYTFID